MKNFFQSRLILFILALGLALRLVAINQSLWLDEAIGALVVKEQSYVQIVTTFPLSDNHPPLYYLILKAWTDVFGYSEVSLRFPSVLFGVGTIWLTYLIGIKVITKKNWKFPEVAALLIATSPFHIYYSQEARMYVMAGFLASLAIYSFLIMIKDKGKKKVQPLWWGIFSFSITALVFTDYMPVFLLPVFWFFAYSTKMDRDWWKRFIYTHLPLLLIGIFWLPIFIQQAERGRWLLSTLPAWSQVAGGATLKQAILVWMKFILGRISLRSKLLYYFLILISSVPFYIAIFRAWVSRRKIALLWLWFIVPLLLGFVASFWFPAFIYFRFTYVIAAFYLIVAWGVAKIKWKLAKKGLISLLLIANISGWLIYVLEPYQQREQWREAVEFIENKATFNDVVVFEFPEPFAPYRWYAEGFVEAVGVTDSISANRAETLSRTQIAVEDKQGVYYFEYLRDLSDPGRYVEMALSNSGFVKHEIFDFFPGVGQITYYKRE